MTDRTNGRMCAFPSCGRDTYGGSGVLCRMHAQQKRRGRELRPIGAKKRIRPLEPHPTDPGLLLVPLTQGYSATIDAIDGPAVGMFNWCALARDYKRQIYGFHHRERELHRFIARLAGIPLDVQIDHVNGDGLDCRRQNLRRATNAQNQWNKSATPASATGIKNVFRTDKGKHPAWVVKVAVNGQRVYVGTFHSEEEAAAEALAAEHRLHGPFAPQRAEAKPGPTP